LQQVSVIAALAIGQTLVILTAGIDLSVGAIAILSSLLMANLAAKNGGARTSRLGDRRCGGATCRGYQRRTGYAAKTATVHCDLGHPEHLYRDRAALLGRPASWPAPAGARPSLGGGRQSLSVPSGSPRA
jgi:ribose/xylose/arabinose/galactoside ABC-type transport system permease subunit